MSLHSANFLLTLPFAWCKPPSKPHPAAPATGGMEGRMGNPTPNIDKLEALILAIGTGPSVSYQLRDHGNRSGFFTVTFYPAGTPRCAIGQGDTLGEALAAARADAAKMLAKSTIADLEKAAA